MKSFISIIVFLTALNAHATGKLIGQLNAWDNGAHTRPMVGLAVYEKLFKYKSTGVFFNSFTGWGQTPFDEKPDTNWFTTKNQLDLQSGKFTLSPGVQLLYVRPEGETRSIGFFRLGYELW